VADEAPITLCAKHLRIAADWVAYLNRQPARPIARACPSCGVAALKVTVTGMSATCEACGSVWRPGHNDHLKAKRDSGVVYYIRFSDRVKIGTTTNLPQRLAGLPHDELLATEPGGPKVELRRHQQFADTQVPGQREWFFQSPELSAHIASLTDDGRRVSTPRSVR
jgi:hypothetical protein